ncbi:MAG: 2'-5' RNA ligase family protein [Candidatus Staskawiczbacteria bacterium]|nr:2'-5' RNA ligase family protein [Candidatus Staskawiczbacteria bacterium]
MNKPDNSTIINICVIPSDQVGVECVNISQSLKSDGTMFVLDGETKFPHMTVYMARFSNDQIPNILKSVGGLMEGAKSFLCKHTGYFMTKGRYFEVSYEKSTPFVALHEKLISELKEYRINPGQPYEEGYFTPYTEAQQNNAKETGYDLAHKLFRPHVTLTRYQEGKVPEINPETPPIDLSFPLQKICVYKADDNGAVYEKLTEFIV